MDNHYGAAALTLQALTFLTLAFISYTNSRIGKAIMSTQDAVNAVVDQLKKAAAEINAKIADLNVQIQDAGVADKVDITELQAAAQVLDDIVPDQEVLDPPF